MARRLRCREIRDREIRGKSASRSVSRVERFKSRQAAETLRTPPNLADRPLAVGILVADEGDADESEWRAASSASIDSRVWLIVPSARRAHRMTGSRHRRRDRFASSVRVERHQQAARAFDDERASAVRRRRAVAASISMPSRSAARCGEAGVLQPIGFGQDARRREAAQPAARVRVGFVRRVPPASASSNSRRALRRAPAAKHRLADAGIGAGDDDALLMPRTPLPPRASSAISCDESRLVDVERERDAQPRGALRHGRRADGADVEAARLHRRRQRHRALHRRR